MEALPREQTSASFYMEELPARRTAGKADHEGSDDSCANPGQTTGQDYPLRQAHKVKKYHHREISNQYPDQPSMQGADSREFGPRCVLFLNIRHLANPTGGWQPRARRGQPSRH